MTVRLAAKHVLPSFVVRLVRRVDVARYVSGGRVPWSPGYVTHHRTLVTRALADPGLMDAFRAGHPLPAGYGVRMDERFVEYPWAFSRIPNGPGAILDAGSTFNHEHIVEQPQLAAKTVHILTLFPEDVCFWHRRISYLFGDLRDIPIRDAFYDTVVCISTLEHVGFVNEKRPDDFVAVMRELRRVLKPGGHLLVTVPFGVAEETSRHQVFDHARVMRAVEAFGPATDVAFAFARYRATGWQWASAAECADARYEPWVMLPPDQRAPRFAMPPDGAAAARAVACIAIVK